MHGRSAHATGIPAIPLPAPPIRLLGNGGIMRLAPVVLFYHPDREAVLHYAGESSRTTHASPECIDAAHLLADVLSRALREASKADVLNRSGPEMFESPSIRSIAAATINTSPRRRSAAPATW